MKGTPTPGTWIDYTKRQPTAMGDQEAQYKLGVMYREGKLMVAGVSTFGAYGTD